ncbi:helix-turn-helix domain-containing protein [Thermosipho atlanticus]|uniref:Diguanylate cyclase (GGDEF) domain-containing protein n=1 Tax=Thermosipho atlanticus DSM 15807 TaxID=1123380 RepID=A0A1M5RB54_9BACT|nr:helix-turn-helix domain-containing protein [Thermosipho atlanticus]SHH23408.1 diguanylate cyclase (GGDEF) domain-containing protein [Thermosipho atlanticus DSM 15807]
MSQEFIECIKNSINYIEQNLFENIHLEDVAKSAHMSVSLYSKIFKNLFNITVKEYIIKRRMSFAAKDLIFTKDSILKIALKYGYSGYEQFSRAFKKLYNVSPSEFRKNGIYVNVFPRITLKINTSCGGEVMKEMENEHVSRLLKDVKGGWILDIDIDHFADINNVFGRKIGDLVLIEISKRIKKVLKEGSIETDVIRIAADEFIVVMKGKNADFVKKNISRYIKTSRKTI